MSFRAIELLRTTCHSSQRPGGRLLTVLEMFCQRLFNLSHCQVLNLVRSHTQTTEEFADVAAVPADGAVNQTLFASQKICDQFDPHVKGNHRDQRDVESF